MPSDLGSGPSSKCQAPSVLAARTSRSHRKQASAAFLVLATVSRRHYENDAVFRPRPKRPRSWGALASSGLRSPSRMARSSWISFIPSPSSKTAIQLSELFQKNLTSTFEALAAMLLSIRSASAPAVVYPSPRNASTIAEARGGALHELLGIIVSIQSGRDNVRPNTGSI